MNTILLIFLFSISNINANDKVKLAVHYESYCPDSSRFITGQLSRAFNEVRDIMDVVLFPFGKANV